MDVGCPEYPRASTVVSQPPNGILHCWQIPTIQPWAPYKLLASHWLSQWRLDDDDDDDDDDSFLKYLPPSEIPTAEPPNRRNAKGSRLPLDNFRLSSNQGFILILVPLFIDRSSIDIIYTRVFFLGKCVRTAAETMVVDRKYQNALALLCLTSRPLPNAANSSGVPWHDLICYVSYYMQVTVLW